MTHLPECPCPTADDDPWYCCPECDPGVTPPWERACICDRLRACEQRVKRVERALWHLKGATYGREQGWNEALDAAREAVEGLRGEDPSWDGTQWNNALYCAEQAIDALREVDNPTPTPAQVINLKDPA